MSANRLVGLSHKLIAVTHSDYHNMRSIMTKQLYTFLLDPNVNYLSI